jgi:hypothetical protein
MPIIQYSKWQLKFFSFFELYYFLAQGTPAHAVDGDCYPYGGGDFYSGTPHKPVLWQRQSGERASRVLYTPCITGKSRWHPAAA